MPPPGMLSIPPTNYIVELMKVSVAHSIRAIGMLWRMLFVLTTEAAVHIYSHL